MRLLIVCVNVPILCLLTALVQAKVILHQGDTKDWDHIRHVGETIYEPIMDIEFGVVIRAESLQSASCLILDEPVNLEQTPVLQWQWTAQTLPYALTINDQGIEQTISKFNETLPQGNDFVLRLIVSRSPIFSETKALHYVWSAHQPIGSHWSIDEHTRVMVVSGEDQIKMKWQTIERNVQQDWYKVFNEQIESIGEISIMTDSDHISGHAVGYYGGIQALANSQPMASH